MARWDEILTLPIQNPPTLEFSAADIVWSRVEGWREKMDRLALIPFSRVNDFVRGESNNKDCPTRFHVEARRRRPPESAYKPKVDGILEYILYWCSFGPDDHRKGGLVRPSRNYASKRKTPAGRPNTKRGCVCHFIVKRLIAEPSVALIIYNQDKHVDKKGAPCHGPMDKKAVGTRAMFAPYISDELRLQIMSLLYVGVPVETIMQKHTEMVQKQGGPCSRDDLLSHRYVRRLERKIRRSTYQLDLDDDASIGMWIESHRDHIFFYEDFSDSDPFVLGIQTEWQLQQMIRFGNQSLMASDSRFGTNKLKCPIHSLLVFDENNNAIPVAWIITSNFTNSEVHKWMGALCDRVRTKDPTWQLGGFIVDDPLADVLTISEIFQSSVLISLWRISHAWRKNLMDKCSDVEMITLLSRRLGEAISDMGRGICGMDFFDAFLEEFVDCSAFLDYFKSIWIPRISAWIEALKSLPMASAEVSSAIECYHHQLKLRLLNEKDPSVYLRADWLVHKLGTKVHSYYWLDEYSGRDNFSRYWKDEWQSGLTSWRLALQIPDSDVVINGTCAKVVHQRDQKTVYTIINAGSQFAVCNCDWSRMGNLCEHIMKSTNTCRLRGLAASSTALFNYKQCLMCILHCPPYDSVIRDHAVALAVSVKSKLNGLLNLEKVTPSTNMPLTREKLSDASSKSFTMGFGTVGDSSNEFQSASGTVDNVRIKERDPMSNWERSEMEAQIDREVDDAVLEDREHQFVSTSFMDSDPADNAACASSDRGRDSIDVDTYGLGLHDQINNDIMKDFMIKEEGNVGTSSIEGLLFSSRPDTQNDEFISKMLTASREDKRVIIPTETLSYATAIHSVQSMEGDCSSSKETFSILDKPNCFQNVNVRHNNEETSTQIDIVSGNGSEEIIKASTIECNKIRGLSPISYAETTSEANASDMNLERYSETAEPKVSSSNGIKDVCINQSRHAGAVKEKVITDTQEDTVCTMHKGSAEADNSFVMDIDVTSDAIEVCKDAEE